MKGKAFLQKKGPQITRNYKAKPLLVFITIKLYRIICKRSWRTISQYLSLGDDVTENWKTFEACLPLLEVVYQ